MRLKDRSGMAVLFDALMFLTVMTLVSVSMLTLLGYDQDEADRQRYVDSVHATILASTISFQDGPPCTLADLVESFLRLGDDLMEKGSRMRSGPYWTVISDRASSSSGPWRAARSAHPSEATCTGMQGTATSTSPSCVGRTTERPWCAV